MVWRFLVGCVLFALAIPGLYCLAAFVLAWWNIMTVGHL